MEMKDTPSVRLPTIDLSAFLNSGHGGTDKNDAARQLHEACREYGAFYVSGHGIDTGQVMEMLRSFFGLSGQDKRSIAVKPGGFTRGYIGMGEESGSDLLEVKEAFSFGFPWPFDQTPANSMQGSNVWPDKSLMPPQWQEGMETFYSRLCGVAEGLTRAFSISYGMQEDHLLQYCSGGETISLVRLFHYFPYQAADPLFPEKKERIGSSPHTDWGFLTLIVQEDNVPGLQIHHGGKWKDILPPERSPDSRNSALLVNCGDYFSLLTGGEYISPLHRVVSSGQERMSAVLFYYPSYDARIPALGGQAYSLFSNQHEQGDTAEQPEPSLTAFGAFIEEKWKQVQRKK